MLELAITIFLAAVVIGFALPQIKSAMTLGNEQQAKASVNGAMDAVVASYSRGGAAKAWDTSVSPPRPGAPEVSAGLIRNQSPDVRVTDSSTDYSTSNNQVSASALLKTDTSSNVWWRVGVASWSGGDNPTCWMAWRDLDAPASSATPNEAFMVVNLSASVANVAAWQGYCTGKVAARLPWIPTSNAVDAGTGKSWAYPREITDLSMVTTAANSAS